MLWRIEVWEDWLIKIGVFAAFWLFCHVAAIVYIITSGWSNLDLSISYVYQDLTSSTGWGLSKD